MKPYEDKKVVDKLKSLPGEERLRLGFELTELSLDLIKSGIRDRTPGISKEELKAELKDIIYNEN